MKICRDCGAEKPLDEYHIHNQMKDGHLNKCKECVRSRIGRHRERNIDKIRAYDRGRGNRQDKSYIKEYREKYPKKYKSHISVGNALRSGKMKKLPCEVCGEAKVVGHHDDYNYPLSVRWMCQAHHKQWHANNGEGLNPL